MPLLGKREGELERKWTGKASGCSSQISMELGHQKCELGWAKKELLELDTGKVDELCFRAVKQSSIMCTAKVTHLGLWDMKNRGFDLGQPCRPPQNM